MRQCPIDVTIEAVFKFMRQMEFPLANDSPDSEDETDRPSNHNEGYL